MTILIAIMILIYGSIVKFIPFYFITSTILCIITKIVLKITITITSLLKSNLIPSLTWSITIVALIFMDTILVWYKAPNVYNAILYTIGLIISIYLYFILLKKSLIKLEISPEESHNISMRISTGIILIFIAYKVALFISR